MEEAKKEAFPRKLDFNLPLLSTRRLGGQACMNSQMGLQDTSNGIPFCWEQAPGKPKNMERNETDDGETPRPRLPPCRWKPQKKANTNDYIDIDDDGCYADVDDNEEEEEDVFSDAVEVLSLTEAIDIVQKTENENEDRLERLNLEMSVKSSERESPNFMMKRFLPDATALAAYSKHFYNNYGEEYVKVSQSYCSQQSAHKGCGLGVLLPRRFKHKLWCVKTPVRHVSPITNLKLHKPSSTHSPFSHFIKKKDI